MRGMKQIDVICLLKKTQMMLTVHPNEPFNQHNFLVFTKWSIGVIRRIWREKESEVLFREKNL